MRFASLGSGSKGNGTVVEWRTTRVLVDCGFSVRETTRRLVGLGWRPEQLTAILVTHEHSDHLGGAVPLARRYGIPLLMTAGTAHAAGIERQVGATLIDAGREFNLGDLGVTAVAVPHDAREPVQFVLRSDRHRLGLLTDLGAITPHVIASYRRCDALVLEANHDAAMLAAGPYPAALKQRVAGPWGHLNNGQAGELLANIDRRCLHTLVIGHMSQHNNRQTLVEAELKPLTTAIPRVVYATQNDGFSWLTLA